MRAFLALVLTWFIPFFAALPANAAQWLAVSDVHFDPHGDARVPSPYGRDTNPALLNRALAAMRRVEPNPPVVLLLGDLLAHHFPNAESASTATYLARRFRAAFPHAQFVLTLGNNDSDCGDYDTTPNGAFLHAVARAWEPLVNRNGSAPRFLADFSRLGSYETQLPNGVRAVVVDDVFWSFRYRNACGTGDPARALSQWTRSELHPSRTPAWFFMHIPFGGDAYSTTLLHSFAAVPFLHSGYTTAIVNELANPAAGVTTVLAGHTHKFAFRLARSGAHAVPALLVPSISPVYDNDPAFLRLYVVGARIVNAAVYRALDGRRAGSLRDLGTDVSAGGFEDLLQRLTKDRTVLARFSRLYMGGRSDRSDVTPATWPVYRCAALEPRIDAFKQCVGSWLRL